MSMRDLADRHEFVDVGRFSTIMGITLASARRMAADGTLPSIKDGKRILFAWPEAKNRLKQMAGVRPSDAIDPSLTPHTPHTHAASEGSQQPQGR